MKQPLTSQQRRVLGIVLGGGVVLVGLLMLIMFTYLIMQPVSGSSGTIRYPAIPLQGVQAARVAGMYMGVAILAILIQALSEWFPGDEKEKKEKAPFSIRREIVRIAINLPTVGLILFSAIRVGLWQMPIDAVPVGANPAEIAGIVKCLVVVQIAVFVFAARDVLVGSVQDYLENRREQKAEKVEAIQA